MKEGESLSKMTTSRDMGACGSNKASMFHIVQRVFISRLPLPLSSLKLPYNEAFVLQLLIRLYKISSTA